MLNKSAQRRETLTDVFCDLKDERAGNRLTLARASVGIKEVHWLSDEQAQQVLGVAKES